MDPGHFLDSPVFKYRLGGIENMHLQYDFLFSCFNKILFVVSDFFLGFLLSFLHFSFLVGSPVTSQNAAVTKTVLLHIQFA